MQNSLHYLLRGLVTLRRAAVSALLVLCVLAFGGALAVAQEGDRLFDHDPFDQITLDAENANTVLKVMPLDLPGRVVPKVHKPDEKLQLRLFASPEKTYEAAWVHIVKVELFEEILLHEAEELVNQNQFDAAYDYLVYLLKNYPKLERLEVVRQNYLYYNAGSLAQQKRFPEALSLLEELYRVNPGYKRTPESPAVLVALGKMAERVIDSYFSAGDFRSTRLLVVRLETEYGEKLKGALEKWRTQLVAAAEKARDKAQEQLAAGKLREAYDSSREMLDIWPTVEGGKALVRQIGEKYPVVIVGVAQVMPEDMRPLWSSWPARRSQRLVSRPLVEFAGFAAEEANYTSPWGELARSDDRRRLTFTLTAPAAGGKLPLSGYEIAQWLLAAANSPNDATPPAWPQVLAGIAVPEVSKVEIDFRTSVLLPAGLVPATIPRAAPAEGEMKTTTPRPEAPYVVEQRKADRVRLVQNAAYAFRSSTQPQEIEERYFRDGEQALKALRRGEIDMLDQVFPADVPALAKDPALTVQAYALPSLHLLVPNQRRPYPANRNFRRAVEYAINRQGILDRILLGEAKSPGSKVICTPFSAGDKLNDPSAYASDLKLTPRAYAPRLTVALAALADKEVKAEAEANKLPAPVRKPLVLVHPANEVARFAVQAIAQQLAATGVECQAQELAPGVAIDPAGEWDFAYVATTLWEPLVEARSLLGAQGLTGTRSAAVSLALARVELAPDWAEARRRFYDLDRVLYDDVTVTPLWQLVEHCAYRKRVQGVGEAPLALYQNIEQWKVAPEAPE